MRRRLSTFGALAVLCASVGSAVTVAGASPARAHPSGHTFLVNQYRGLTLSSDRIEVVAVLNTGTLVTRQDRRVVDADRDGTVDRAERSRYAELTCTELAAAFDVRVDGERLKWSVQPSDYRYEAVTGGLPTARLDCALSSPARLTAAAAVSVANRYLPDKDGWQELTARAAGDVHLVASPVPGHSLSDELRAYPPAEALVLHVREALLHVEPGSVPASAIVATAPATPAPATTATAAPAGLALPGLSGVERRLEDLAGGRLTPLLGVLALLVALLVGAGHAALPGHGKTVLAVYLAGRRGRPRDALAVGAAVTLSHTGAVLVFGALISAGTAFAGQSVLRAAGLVSGLLVVAVGAGMLFSHLRRSSALEAEHHHAHGHVHGHGHGHTHGHAHGHAQDHDHRTGRFGVVGIGLAGGLVPSPSALVVLLVAVGLGRAPFGVLLVLAYGLGMAGTLTSAGLLLLAVRDRMCRARWTSRLPAPFTRLAVALWPVATPAVVLLVGIGLVARGALVVA